MRQCMIVHQQQQQPLVLQSDYNIITMDRHRAQSANLTRTSFHPVYLLQARFLFKRELTTCYTLCFHRTYRTHPQVFFGRADRVKLRLGFGKIWEEGPLTQQQKRPYGYLYQATRDSSFYLTAMSSLSILLLLLASWFSLIPSAPILAAVETYTKKYYYSSYPPDNPYIVSGQRWCLSPTLCPYTHITHTTSHHHRCVSIHTENHKDVDTDRAKFKKDQRS